MSKTKKKYEKVKVTCPVCGKSVKARGKTMQIIAHTMPFNDPREKKRCSGSGSHVQA